jgi:hypothetical protein
MSTILVGTHSHCGMHVFIPYIFYLEASAFSHPLNRPQLQRPQGSMTGEGANEQLSFFLSFHTAKHKYGQSQSPFPSEIHFSSILQPPFESLSHPLMLKHVVAPCRAVQCTTAILNRFEPPHAAVRVNRRYNLFRAWARSYHGSITLPKRFVSQVQGL